MKISLQLYSVRSEIEKGFKEAVKKVGEIGYDGVEFAGYGGLNAEEMKSLLAESNLYSVGSHSSVDVFKNSFKEELEFHKTIGSEYIICPYAKFESKQDVEDIINMLNSAAEEAAKYGIKVGYHNHAHEFEKFDDKYILDMIAEGTTDNVVLEVDVFWVNRAGVNPYEYIEKWGKRVELVHLKQSDAELINVDIPDGIIDMNKVIEISKYAKHFIVEQETYDKPVWDSVKNDVDFMKK